MAYSLFFKKAMLAWPLQKPGMVSVRYPKNRLPFFCFCGHQIQIFATFE